MTTDEYEMTPSLPARTPRGPRWESARDQARNHPGFWIKVAEGDDKVQIWNTTKTAAGDRHRRTRNQHGNGIEGKTLRAGDVWVGYIMYEGEKE